MTPDKILSSIQNNPVVASTPDDRDYIYQTRQGPFPAKCDLKPDVFEIENQLTIGSCVANAFVGTCEHLLKSHSTAQSLSRLFPYYNGRIKLENQTGEGMQPRDGAKALNHWGTPLESLYPYDISKENVEPGPDIYAAALPYMVTRYERIPVANEGQRTVEANRALELAIKSALSEGLPVVIATHVGIEIRTLTGPWQTHKMNSTSGLYKTPNTYIGNHMTLIIGYDDSIVRPNPLMNQNGSWLDQNSWGRTYGDGGFFGYPYAALASDAMEAYVIRGFADVMINPVPEIPYITRPEVVLDWYHKVFRNDVVDPMDPNVQYWAHDLNFPRSFLGTWRDIVLAKVAELEATL